MGSKSIACKPALLNKPAELASTAATDVGMHGLLASQYRVTIPCYPLVCVHCGPVVDFFITKQTSLHPFDFVRNLFHLLVRSTTVLACISCQAELVLLAVSLTALCLASAYLSRVDFFKVGKIAQLNTVSHGQCMSSLLIKHWSVTDKLDRRG